SFKAAIALDPALPGPYRNLGLVYLAMKPRRCDDAVAAFREYLKLRPVSKWTTRVEQEIMRCSGPAPVVSSPETELALVTITASSGGKPLDGAVVRID